MQIQVLTRTQYKTSDGSTYDSEQKAIDHEVLIQAVNMTEAQFGETVEVQGVRYHYSKVAFTIIKYEKEIRAVLEIMDKARGDLEAAKRSRDSLDINA